MENKKPLTKEEIELLDTFAAAALQGLLASPSDSHFRTTADRAYRLAAYMLESREEAIKKINDGKD